VSAFKIDKQSGMLRFINQQSSGGAAPCHLAVNKEGTCVLAGNYSGGNMSVLPVSTDGSLGPLVGLIQHSGSGVNLKNQAAPHVHCVVLDKSNKFAIVADLGIDKIMVYPFDGENGEINKSGVQSTSTHSGAGPRHLVLSGDERFLYSINELNSTITVFMFDRLKGTLKEIQTLPTLPPEFSGGNSCADIHVHPSGKFLYGSNRGHDTIAAYKRDQETGMLSLIELVSTRGKNPRNFAIDPGGNFLLVANQDTNNIFSFRIDQETGRLNATGTPIEIPTPVCIRFL
jgi:6-phosphogluconolactonase